MENQKKVCRVCKKLKTIDEFYRNRSRYDGRQSECKKCDEKRKSGYYRTKNGLITRIYNSQCLSSIRRGHILPSYSKQELKEWTLNQLIFHILYDNWENSGYEKMLIPSFDRINDYLGYSLDNIQITTWKENFDKGHLDKKNGINNKNSKAVISTHKITGEQTEYYSAMQASRETNIAQASISRCCLDKVKTAGGFYWRFN